MSSDLANLENAELKEAFDAFDKVKLNWVRSWRAELTVEQDDVFKPSLFYVESFCYAPFSGSFVLRDTLICNEDSGVLLLTRRSIERLRHMTLGVCLLMSKLLIRMLSD